MTACVCASDRSCVSGKIISNEGINFLQGIQAKTENVQQESKQTWWRRVYNIVCHLFIFSKNTQRTYFIQMDLAVYCCTIETTKSTKHYKRSKGSFTAPKSTFTPKSSFTGAAVMKVSRHKGTTLVLMSKGQERLFHPDHNPTD